MQYPLSRLPGVGQVRVFGAGPYSMRVWLDPKRLQDFNLTTQDVQNAIADRNVQVVAGQLGAPPVPADHSLQLTINSLGRMADIKQFEDIVIKSERGTTAQMVRLRDIARVDLGQQFYSNFANMGGKKPAQCALWLRSGREKRTNWFYRGFNRAYQAMKGPYMNLVRWMVNRSVLMSVVFFVIIALTGWAFVHRPSGFLPTEDQGFAVLFAKLPDGAAQPRALEVSEKISAILKKTPGVSGWVTIGGYSFLDAANVSTVSTTFVVYENWNKRGAALSQEKIVAGLNRDLSGIQEALAFVVIPPSIRGLGQSGGFQMMLEERKSLGLDDLQKATGELIQRARSEQTLQGLTTTFNASSPQLYLHIDRTKAQSFQVPLSNVFETLRGYLGSSFVNLFNKFDQVYQVYIQANDRFRLKPEDIKNLYTRNIRGEMVPLGSLIEVRPTQGPELITRYNLYPAAAIFGSTAPGFSSGQALSLMENLAAQSFPKGVGYDWTATSYQEKRVGNQAYFIYLISLTLVFLVLAALYESWISPAAVILAVPMALVGVLLALIIRGFDNNLYTQIGLVLMIALASKNAILIVEFARDLQREGMSAIDAAIEATSRRFRPIMMTSFAFILGVVPLLFAKGAGAAGQQAIGTAVFGGMLASTLLAIPFVPVLYVFMQRLSGRGRQPEKETGMESYFPAYREEDPKNQ